MNLLKAATVEKKFAAETEMLLFHNERFQKKITGKTSSYQYFWSKASHPTISHFFPVIEL